jgi:excisionase family DNA binding protein
MNANALVAEADNLDLLTVDQVAALLGFTRKGIYGLVGTRRIPFVRLPSRGARGGAIRFVRAELLQWLQQNRVPTLER